ncbi:MAG: DUF1559 domain-containing protein [Opitutaceae bacterium]|jgi:general secretion pathway protein G|nr:DUF1559 domain-containing protein [Opitutaceae bacterium]
METNLFHRLHADQVREEFPIPDFRFPNDQAATSATATQRHGSAQSKIENPKSKISRGFTLIELLTVIAIIGILAAIIIPTVSQVRQSARRAQCFSNLKSIMTAAHLYANDNKGKFPRTADPLLGTYNDGKPNPNGRGLVDLLYDYLNKDCRVLYCPGVDAGCTATFEYQNARTDGQRLGRIGYYWLNSDSLTAFSLNPPPNPQLQEGESSRVLVTCIVNLSNAGRPHKGNFNIGFADGHTGTLGKGKGIGPATLDSSTMLLKKQTLP